MRNIFNTGKGCVGYQLYFEAEQLPAKIIIKKMKLIFFHYIISQKEESLMFRFLMAQRKDPIKGDRYSIIHEIMQEFDFGENEEVIKYIAVKMFKKIVKQKGKIAGVTLN